LLLTAGLYLLTVSILAFASKPTTLSKETKSEAA
jgi:hypothetical protein